MYRIIGADGREYGPFSADQLRQWIAENRANASTPTLAAGASEWKPLGALPEFSMLFGAPAPAPGTPAVYPSGSLAPQKTNGFAIASMVLGIISLTLGLCCCYGLPFSLPGLVFSLVALGQIKSQPNQNSGRTMAIIGLVLCCLSLLLAALLFSFGIASAFFSPTAHHGRRL